MSKRLPRSALIRLRLPQASASSQGGTASIALGSLASGTVVDYFSIASTMHFGGLLTVLSLLVITTFGTRHASLKHMLDKHPARC
ncbi:hypothetical protein B0G80_8110 [Paraburkholderia sp. BL6669N2]|uniref:hypothetical protein n=1 Tax=Paraburkholderia sp. BL6669N2 TaxID=1938807 RepID=UPI000E37DFC4|nr:hypothetical protein [Paraburkholderia sp. BL6669N2]REG51609.1 hypothetical protein B0G80_8110 [Paraburkholderia sp. BL6669N2]